MDFFPVNWGSDSKAVYMFGLLASGDKAAVCVGQVPHTIFIQLPQEPPNGCYESYIQDLSGKLGVPVVSYELEYFYSLIGAQVDETLARKKYAYLRMRFPYDVAAQEAVRKLKGGLWIGGQRQVIEAHMEWVPLWYQMCLYNKLPVSSWIKVTGATLCPEAKKRTRFAREFTVPSASNLCLSQLIVPPSVDIFSWDIEVYTPVPGKFPKADCSQDIVFMISVVYGGEVVLLHLEPEIELENRWADLGKLTTVAYPTENALLCGFAQLIERLQPLVMCGYNNMGFDWPYVTTRSQQVCKCWPKFANLGYLKFAKSEVKALKWSSSAYSNQSFEFLQMCGVANLDLLPLVRYDYKLATYSLDAVAAHFLGQVKDGVSARQMQLAFQSRHESLAPYAEVGAYCIQDSALVLRLLGKLKVFDGLVALSSVTNSSIEDLVIRATTHKITCTILRSCVDQGVMFERKPRSSHKSYRGAVVFEPKFGLHTNLVSFDFASLYPNIMRTYNLCVSTLVDEAKSAHIPDEACHVMEWEDHVGCEHDPLSNHKKAVLKDLASRKRKVEDMGGWVNDCKLTLAKAEAAEYKTNQVICSKHRYRWFKGYKGTIPTLLDRFLEGRDNVKKTMKAEKKKLAKLLNEGREAEARDVRLYIDSLDCLQLAFKRVANGTYGFTGCSTSMIATVQIAACTTYMGRTIIGEAASLVSSVYKGQCVYGDTDSNYVKFEQPVIDAWIEANQKEYEAHLEAKAASKKADNIPYEPCHAYEKLWFFAKWVSSNISARFPSFLKLEFEDKIYAHWVIVNKKKYGFQLLREDGSLNPKVQAKGLVTVKRDSCKFVQDYYKAALLDLFAGASSEAIAANFLAAFYRMVHRQLPLTDFVFTKSVGDSASGKATRDSDGKMRIGDYAVRKDEVSALPAHVQLSLRLNKLGQCITPGQRIEYVVVEPRTFGGSMGHKLMCPKFVKLYGGLLQVDFLYYANSAARAVDSLLNCIYAFQVPPNRVDSFARNYGNRSPRVRKLAMKLVQAADRHAMQGPLNVVVQQAINRNSVHNQLRALFAPEVA